MDLPHGLTEEVLIETLNKVLRNLAGKFRFGYHDIEDIKQQGMLDFIEKGLQGWDGKRPLDSYAYSHIRHRLINFKRDNYFRKEPPCTACPFYDPKCKKSVNKCAEFTDKNDCLKWVGWINRNESKKNIISPIDISDVDDENEERMRMSGELGEIFDKKEVLDYLEQNVPIVMRADYLKILHGISVPKKRKEEIMLTIKSLIEIKYGQNQEEN